MNEPRDEALRTTSHGNCRCGRSIDGIGRGEHSVWIERSGCRAGAGPVRGSTPGNPMKTAMVGAIGFEPTTPGPRDQCATRLRHAPTTLPVSPLAATSSPIKTNIGSLPCLPDRRAICTGLAVLFIVPDRAPAPPGPNSRSFCLRNGFRADCRLAGTRAASSGRKGIITQPASCSSSPLGEQTCLVNRISTTSSPAFRRRC